MPVNDPTPAGMALGMALRACRRERGMTQAALGEKADIHPTWISRLEGGRLNPTWVTVLRLTRALEIRPIALIARTEEMERKLTGAQGANDDEAPLPPP